MLKVSKLVRSESLKKLAHFATPRKVVGYVHAVVTPNGHVVVLRNDAEERKSQYAVLLYNETNKPDSAFRWTLCSQSVMTEEEATEEARRWSEWRETVIVRTHAIQKRTRTFEPIAFDLEG